LGFWEKFGDDFGSNRGFWSKNGGWRVSLWDLGKIGKVETFENVRKHSKTFKNIQKYSNFEWKRLKIFENLQKCAAFEHTFLRIWYLVFSIWYFGDLQLDGVIKYISICVYTNVLH
jgi:hypothetical protein